jgi:hypothetical protein
MSLLFLASFPRFWADMHFNVKDVPETIFFALTIMAFWAWHENPGWGKAVLTGILFACALGVKANAIFILPILAAAILPKSIHPAEWSVFFRQTLKRLPHYAVMGAVSLAFYVMSWPYLYANPLNNLKGYWGYILSQGGREGGLGWNIDPIRQLVTTMPEFMLLLLGIGLVLVSVKAFKKSSSIWLLLVLWLAVPVLRASLPGMVNFNGIRHFLEFVPAAALIAGYGVSQLVSRAGRQREVGLFWSGAAALILLIANLAGIYPRFYPYLHLYYNSLAGGLSGAPPIGVNRTRHRQRDPRPARQRGHRSPPPGCSERPVLARAGSRSRAHSERWRRIRTPMRSPAVPALTRGPGNRSAKDSATVNAYAPAG